MKEKSFAVIKITCITIIVILSIKIFDIENAFLLFPPRILLLLQLLWFVLFIVIFNKNFEDFFKKYNCILWGIIIAFIYIDGEVLKAYKVLSDKNRLFSFNEIFIILRWAACIIIKFRYYLSNLILLIIIEKILFLHKSNKNNIRCGGNSKKEIFKVRESDLALLQDYINDDSVYGIAIDGEYGSGKTFLVDKLKEAKINEFEFINILSISANEDSVEEYILKQLKQVMISSGVFCSSVDDIMSYLSKIKFLNLFDNKPTCFEKYNDIKTKIKLINKRIVFIVDDLDRVKNFDKIIKIFNVFELLKCKEIKCLYLYDLEILVEIFKNNIEFKKDVATDEKEGKYTHLYNYIRKYIDREIFLKEIDDYNEYAKICGSDNEAVGIFIQEAKRLDTKIKSITANRKNFNYYCKFNPRILYMIFTEYLNAIRVIEVNKSCNEDVSLLKTKIIDWLIFKYFFQKMYFMFNQFEGKFEEFLVDTFKSKSGYDDLIIDALNHLNIFNTIGVYEEIDKLEKCIFILDLFGYDSNTFSVQNKRICYQNDKLCNIINVAGNVVMGIDDNLNSNKL